jgi:hypothetical protein
MFAKADGKYLYLGFEFDSELGIRPCKREDAYYNAERNIENDDGLKLLELVESFLYSSDVTGISAKFKSANKGLSGHFWSREGHYMEYIPSWNEPDLPARYW